MVLLTPEVGSSWQQILMMKIHEFMNSLCCCPEILFPLFFVLGCVVVVSIESQAAGPSMPEKSSQSASQSHLNRNVKVLGA